MNHQLILGVQRRDQATFDSYWPGKNLHLVEELKKSLKGAGERLIYFYGVGGTGRTHLLQACCQLGASQSVYLPLSEWQHFTPAVFQGLETLSLVCVDDIDSIAGQPAWEEAFFYFFNRIREHGGLLLVTAKCVPAAAGFHLPDLVSRLAGGMIFQLQPLADEDKLGMLVMRATQRGMVLSLDAARFILTHCPRHLSTLCAALDALDRASLAAQRRLTVPFIKNVLEI